MKGTILLTVLLLLVVVSAEAQHSVVLTWGAPPGCPAETPDCQGNLVPCSHITGYKVYRAPDVGGVPGTFTLLSSTTGPLTSYTDSTVAPNDVWWYRVTAMLDNSCETPCSNEIEMSVPPAFGDVMFWDATGEWIARSPLPPIQVQSTPLGTPPKPGDILMWFSSRWMPRTPVTPVGAKTPRSSTMAVINGIPVGNILVWNGTAWAPKTPTTPVKARH